MRSASLFISRPRSEAFIFGQGPVSNALRAALTAKSTSAVSPSATWQIVSPVAVAGLRVGNVLPETLSSRLPPMKSGWSLTLGGLTVRGLVTVAVAMPVPPVESKDADVAIHPCRGLSHWRGRVVKEGGTSLESQ